MNNNELIYYKNISPIIGDFCKPLNDYFGITLFNYMKIYNKEGKYTFFSNNIPVTHDYITKLSWCNLFFQNFLNVNSKYDIIFWPKTPENKAMKLFLNHGFWHGITLVQQNKENIEIHTFASNKNNNRINEFFVKNFSLLEQFVIYFRSIFNDNLILQSEKHLITFKKGCSFILPENNTNYFSDKYNIQKFFQASNLNQGVISLEGNFINLTARERECLDLINKGFTIKEISRELLLAPKTIEVHLNNIKNKTGYRNKRKLIQLYRSSFMES